MDGGRPRGPRSLPLREQPAFALWPSARPTCTVLPPRRPRIGEDIGLAEVYLLIRGDGRERWTRAKLRWLLPYRYRADG